MNFATPLLVLMTTNSKRNPAVLGTVCVIVLIGHFCDFFLMIMPGTVGESGTFGFIEMGLTLIYLGLFASVVLRALTKAALIDKNHPYLQESLHHQD